MPDNRYTSAMSFYLDHMEALEENALRDEIQAILQKHRKHTRAKITAMVELIRRERTRR